MRLVHNLNEYITSVRMSKKKRVLVEGKDDRAHLSNLLNIAIGEGRIKIDVAAYLKGTCRVTSKNHRAKIQAIHEACKSKDQFSNLFLLCDRETHLFNVEDCIKDNLSSENIEGNLFYTRGHSIENYFIDFEIVSVAYQFLTGSEHKLAAIELFEKILPSVIRTIAAISLAAQQVNKLTFPIGVISWTDFKVVDSKIEFNIEHWKAARGDDLSIQFAEHYRKCLGKAENTDVITCARICRGHTAMQFLQRIFSLCLYEAAKKDDEKVAEDNAKDFSSIRESVVSNALCQSWLNSIQKGNENFPVELVSTLSA